MGGRVQIGEVLTGGGLAPPTTKIQMGVPKEVQ